MIPHHGALRSGSCSKLPKMWTNDFVAPASRRRFCASSAHSTIAWKMPALRKAWGPQVKPHIAECRRGGCFDGWKTAGGTPAPLEEAFPQNLWRLALPQITLSGEEWFCEIATIGETLSDPNFVPCRWFLWRSDWKVPRAWFHPGEQIPANPSAGGRRRKLPGCRSC